MKVHSHECRDRERERERERDVSERSRVAENASSLEKGARAGKDKIFDGIDWIEVSFCSTETSHCCDLTTVSSTLVNPIQPLI